MSSPSIKINNDAINNKQRKSTKNNSSTKSTNLDTRAELADIIKKKAETSVGFNNVNILNKVFEYFFYMAAGAIGQFGKANLCI